LGFFVEEVEVPIRVGPEIIGDLPGINGTVILVESKHFQINFKDQQQ
jgi:hypothetical protein